MSRMMRIYYYGVAGAIGGLFGWHLSNLVGLSFTPWVYLSEILVGAIIGAAIGLAIGILEGVLKRNIAQALKAILISGGLGALGGAISLPLAEGLFQLGGAGVLARISGWTFFGLLTGAAIGTLSGIQAWKSGLGGLLGGLTGGALLEAARGWLKDPLLGKALGLILLGAAVGSFIALIVYLLSRAWIEVKSGKLKGMEFILDKFAHKNGPSAFIGSDALKSEIVLPDPDISPQHAMLKGFDTHFMLKDMSLSGTFVNNRKIESAQLNANQVIRLGNTELVYHEKR